MARGSSADQGSSGDNISHFTAIRLRVVGAGNLKLKVYSLDNVRSKDLADLPLEATTEKLPTRLCNFTTVRASFQGKTTQIDDYFRVNRIIVYSKEVATSWPG